MAATQQTEKDYLSDIEQALVRDNDGQYKDTLLNQLFTEALELKAEKGKGLAPDDYARVDNVLTAVVAAMEVIDKCWTKHHPKH